MLRSPPLSTSLKTYVPAGRICAPTPGTSTGELKVITVLLFQSSALALERAVTTTRQRQKIIAPTLIRSILIIRFTSKLSWGRSILPRHFWFETAVEMNWGYARSTVHIDHGIRFPRHSVL